MSLLPGPVPTPDLTYATAVLTGLMTETGRIVRPTPDSRADAIDPLTLRVKDHEDTPIYAGVMKIRPNFRSPAADEGGRVKTVQEYFCDIALVQLTIEPRVGDYITVDTSLRDPGLPGLVFRVTEPFYKTFAAQRRMRCERRQVINDRP